MNFCARPATATHHTDTFILILGAALVHDSIDDSILTTLAAVGGLDDVRVFRTEAGYHLSVRYARSGLADWRLVRSRREPVRTWRSLDTLSNYLDRLGVRQYRVELLDMESDHEQ
ncbi:hypothetical protein IFR09_23020 [Pseudomonas syringae]|nr:hypothetical protein [Pseudomonas syringae]MBD8803218.1 hypothetical protein [Pseudomonas syringae]MBD8814038.1 hypothetical protein [Pseudomonas syringae]